MHDDQATPLPRYFTKRSELRCLHSLAQKHSQQIGSYSQTETTQMSISWQMGIQTIVLPYSGKLYNNKKEQITNGKRVSVNLESIMISQRIKSRKTTYSTVPVI